jgi:hypothetical protein
MASNQSQILSHTSQIKDQSRRKERERNKWDKLPYQLAHFVRVMTRAVNLTG